MVRIAVFTLVASSSVASAWSAFRNSNNKAFLSADMQPGVVAKTLSHVETEWKSQAQSFVACEVIRKEAVTNDCNEAPQAFGKSCSTVVTAVVGGSNGDPKVMAEYMGDVCTQKVMSSWHQTVCNGLAQTIMTKLTASDYDNRNNFKTKPVCDAFWSSFLAEQKTLHAEEIAASKEKEEKDAEAAAKEVEYAKVKAEKKKEEEAADEKRDDATRVADGDAEHAATARRNGKIDRDLDQKESEVAAIEAEANKKLDEASKVEAEVGELELDAHATQANQATEVTEAAVAKAEVAQPAVAKAEVAQPAVAKAEVAQPVVAKAQVTKKADRMAGVGAVANTEAATESDAAATLKVEVAKAAKLNALVAVKPAAAKKA